MPLVLLPKVNVLPLFHLLLLPCQYGGVQVYLVDTRYR